MAAQYPSAVKTFTAIVDGVDYPQATQLNQVYDEVTALQQALLSTGLAHALFPDATSRTLGSSTKPWGTTYVNALAFIGDTANAYMTSGLTVNQGANDDEILALKSSDVAHGVTNLCETDTYGLLKKGSAAAGGLLVRGVSEDGTAGVALDGTVGTADASKGTTSVGAITVEGWLITGANRTTVGANGNLFAVRDQSFTRLVVDAEGDVHYDGTTNASAWDDHDDVALLESLREVTAAPNFKHRFAKNVEAHKQVLAETGILTLNENGHHFVSLKGLQGLIIDAIRQLGMRQQRLAHALLAEGIVSPAQLEAR